MNDQDFDTMPLEELNILLEQAESLARRDKAAGEAIPRLRAAIQRKHDKMGPEEIEEKEGHMHNDNIPSSQPGKQNPY